jgi:hypothetical protein
MSSRGLTHDDIERLESVSRAGDRRKKVRGKVKARDEKVEDALRGEEEVAPAATPLDNDEQDGKDGAEPRRNEDNGRF